MLTFAKWSLLVSGFVFFIFDLLGFKTEPRKIRGRRVKGKKEGKKERVESSFHSFLESWLSEQQFQPTRLQVATVKNAQVFCTQIC